MMASTDNFRILIIDDDVKLNALLTEYLQSFGHTLRSATTAAAGREQLRRELPDLLILVKTLLFLKIASGLLKN